MNCILAESLLYQDQKTFMFCVLCCKFCVVSSVLYDFVSNSVSETNQFSDKIISFFVYSFIEKVTAFMFTFKHGVMRLNDISVVKSNC